MSSARPAGAVGCDWRSGHARAACPQNEKHHRAFAEQDVKKDAVMLTSVPIVMTVTAGETEVTAA
jgi:hypothetical protein